MNYSTIKRRLLAFIIDIFLIGGFGVLVLIVGMTLIYPNGNAPESSILMIFLPFIMIWIYFILGHTIYGTTIGKKLLHLKVTNTKGDRLNGVKVVIREFLKLFSFPLFNGLFSMFHNKQRRAWYEIISGSAVIKTDKIENALSLNDPKKFIQNNKALTVVIVLIFLFFGFVIYSGKDAEHTTDVKTQSFAEQIKDKKVEKIDGPKIISSEEYSGIYTESAEKISNEMSSLADILADEQKVMEISLNTDEESKDKFLSNIASIQNEYAKMKEITPPEELKPFYKDYLKALEYYNNGCDELINSFDDTENSEAHMHNTTVYFQSGNDTLEIMATKYSK